MPAAAPMPSATATCTPANTIASMSTSNPTISPVPNMDWNAAAPPSADLLIGCALGQGRGRHGIRHQRPETLDGDQHVVRRGEQAPDHHEESRRPYRHAQGAFTLELVGAPGVERRIEAA